MRIKADGERLTGGAAGLMGPAAARGWRVGAELRWAKVPAATSGRGWLGRGSGASRGSLWVCHRQGLGFSRGAAMGSALSLGVGRHPEMTDPGPGDG